MGIKHCDQLGLILSKINQEGICFYDTPSIMSTTIRGQLDEWQARWFQSCCCLAPNIYPHTEYEPELFPAALTIRLTPAPSMCINLFASGRFMLLGVCNAKQIKEAVNMLTTLVKKLKNNLT
jgi:hypothetical protein